MDKFRQFANSWKTVGVTNKVRWSHGSAIERFNSYLLKNLLGYYGDNVKPIIADTSFSVGLDDGKKICENLNLDPNSTRDCITPIETVSLLSGIDSEIIGDGRKSNRPVTIRVKGCIFSGMFEGFDADVKSASCEKYSLGLVRAVSDKADLKVSKKCCVNNKYCEFVVNLR
jgi:hypothetical protein